MDSLTYGPGLLYEINKDTVFRPIRFFFLFFNFGPICVASMVTIYWNEHMKINPELHVGTTFVLISVDPNMN